VGVEVARARRLLSCRPPRAHRACARGLRVRNGLAPAHGHAGAAGPHERPTVAWWMGIASGPLPPRFPRPTIRSAEPTSRSRRSARSATRSPTSPTAISASSMTRERSSVTRWSACKWTRDLTANIGATIQLKVARRRRATVATKSRYLGVRLLSADQRLVDPRGQAAHSVLPLFRDSRRWRHLRVRPPADGDVLDHHQQRFHRPVDRQDLVAGKRRGLPRRLLGYGGDRLSLLGAGRHPPFQTPGAIFWAEDITAGGIVLSYRTEQDTYRIGVHRRHRRMEGRPPLRQDVSIRAACSGHRLLPGQRLAPRAGRADDAEHHRNGRDARRGDRSGAPASASWASSPSPRSRTRTSRRRRAAVTSRC